MSQDELKPLNVKLTVEVSAFELKHLESLLMGLVDANLDDSTNLKHVAACKIYDGIINRLNNRNGIHVDTQRRINALKYALATLIAHYSDIEEPSNELRTVIEQARQLVKEGEL